MSSHEREVIGVDDRVSVGRAIPLGIQHMMSMFGSTVLVPVLTGLDPNVAIMCSGIGTICYLLVTGNKIPSYLGSSFAFISPILAVGARRGSTPPCPVSWSRASCFWRLPASLGLLVPAGSTACCRRCSWRR